MIIWVKRKELFYTCFMYKTYVMFSNIFISPLKKRRKNVICICLCLSQCSWKTFWHSNLCGGDNFSRLQSLTKCWHTVFKWGSWGQKQSALLPSPHHSMLWCLLLYSLLVAHTVQQHSIAWRGWGRDPGEYSGFQVRGIIDWRQKSKPKKIPGPKFNPQKIPFWISKP